MAAFAPMPSARVRRAAIREPGPAEECPHPVADVVEGRLDHRQAALLAVRFLHLRRSSETPARCRAGLADAHPPPHVLVHEHLEMKVDLVVQVVVTVHAPEEAGEAGPQPAHRSILTECRDRVDAQRAHGGHEMRRGGHHGHRRRGRCERDRIRRADVEEQRPESARREQSSDGADHQTGQDRGQAAAEHQPQNVGGPGAKRDADAQFARALRHEVGDDPVEADRGEHQRDIANAPSSSMTNRRLATASETRSDIVATPRLARPD